MVTMADRCDCPYPDPMTYGGPNPLCPEHGDVDAILASGEYRDRKGRTWFRCETPCVHGGGWWLPRWSRVNRLEDWHLTPDQMRTLIERDMHRAVCPGLRWCASHPAPHVIYWRGSRHYVAYNLATRQTETHPTLGAALDAARHTTGETP